MRENSSLVMYLEQSDKAKYGWLITGLATEQSLNNDQYPKSTTHANHVLSSHRYDNADKKNQKPPRAEKSEEEKEEEKLNLAFAQAHGLEGKCYVCGKENHKSPQCFHRNKTPKE